jgi:glycosyltransferase involved in cell wall biosynthesis
LGWEQILCIRHGAKTQFSVPLKIGVNSRMILEKGTGVPNYVAYLYRKCLEIDPANQYVFFQPNASRTLGTTEVASTLRGLPGAALFDGLRVQQLIRRTQPDVFHGPSYFLPLRKLAGIKYVVTVHDLAFRVMPEQYGWKHRWYFGWQLARSLKMADAVVADSFNTKTDVIRFYGFPAERIHVVHLGAADHFARAAERPGERLIAGRYFFSVTTHPARKNILGALAAFARFAAGSDLTCVVAGLIGESQRRELLACAERLGIRQKTMLFGYADDQQLINLYRHAEFFIYPSFYEGFGLPVVEAMACGSPVIASNASSLPEIMPDAEWLVDPYDIGNMAQKMERMLALSPDERRRIGAGNQQHARNFTWEKAAVRMIEIFEGLHRDKGHSSSRPGSK